MFDSRAAALLIVLALLAGSGCLKSSTSQASSESSSDSSSSFSNSSGSSSGPTGYVRDVRETTRLWVVSGGEVADLQRQLGKIASRKGVSDWEQDQATYEGIGRGFKKSGVRGERLERLKNQLAGPNPQSTSWMMKGYDAEKAD